MLNMPEEVKSLLHQDTCYKNIRISFPNDERSDICNDLIVKGSVYFKESLCSTDKLQFGLCEASVFECETVGVGDISGAKIEVSCEIECPASVDGAEWRVDLQKHVYSIPYGLFVVSECKRQADLIHRKIVAYSSFAVSNYSISPTELVKTAYPSLSDNSYNPITAYFIAANGFNIIDNIVDKTEITLDFDIAKQIDIVVPADTPQVGETYLDVILSGKQYVFDPVASHGYITDVEAIYYMDQLKYKVKQRELKEQITNESISIITENTKLNTDNLKRALEFIYDGVVEWKNTPQNYAVGARFFPLYPMTTSNITLAMYCITGIEIRLKGYDGQAYYPIEEETIDLTDGTPKLTKHKIKEIYTVPYWARIQTYIHRIYVGKDSNNRSLYNIDWSRFDLRNQVLGLGELSACFIKEDRSVDGTNKLISIKPQFGLTPDIDLYPNENLYPEGVIGGKILPNDYQYCWYVDDYIKPFGAVRCNYKDKTSGEESLYILYLTGFDEESDKDTYQTYDLSDNLLLGTKSWDRNEIETFCGDIAKALIDVKYMPIELKGRGLPYIEAGDTLEVFTKSNDSITTIVLKRELEGEHTLTDTYKSV